MVSRYRAGARVKELVSEFGISRETVCQHLNRRGVERRVQGLRAEDVPKAVELYRSGWSLAKISATFETSSNTVRARLLGAGVQMRDTHGRER